MHAGTPAQPTDDLKTQAVPYYWKESHLQNICGYKSQLHYILHCFEPNLIYRTVQLDVNSILNMEKLHLIFLIFSFL